MKLQFFDSPINRNQLKPLCLNRPIAKLRIGIDTLEEKWESLLQTNSPFGYLTEDYLSEKYGFTSAENQLYINGSIIANELLVAEINNLKPNEALVSEEVILAIKTNEKLAYGFTNTFSPVETTSPFKVLSALKDFFLINADIIKDDFSRITKNRVSETVTDKFTSVYNSKDVFLEKGVSIKSAIINAEDGPVYIGQNAIIQEGAIIIGPVAIGHNSMVAYGAKIRPGTTLGPVCRVGGEVGKTVFMGYSNKAHDGFLGNSVIGQWCNLGANTNNSNLKNNYKPVTLYNFETKSLESSNEIFAGSFIGDYTKIGISTMLNTGTVIGVSSNVYGAGFQSKYIPSFSWGGAAEGYSDYKFDKAIEVIKATQSRRDIELDQLEIKILKYLAENN